MGLEGTQTRDNILWDLGRGTLATEDPGLSPHSATN